MFKATANNKEGMGSDLSARIRRGSAIRGVLPYITPATVFSTVKPNANLTSNGVHRHEKHEKKSKIGEFYTKFTCATMHRQLHLRLYDYIFFEIFAINFVLGFVVGI